MNLSDLFVVLALAGGLYGLIVALARQRHFLSKAVNPHRWPWLLAGITALWFGAGLLRMEAQSWAPEDLSRVLMALVTDSPLSTRGKVASVSVLLGALILVLVLWCQLNYPRDPSTFSRPHQQGRALRYYVGSLKTGLDYAVLMRPGGQRLEEAWAHKHIRRALAHLPRLAGPNAADRVARTLEEQVDFWRATAEKIHESMPHLDAAVAPAHHGGNRRLVFDTEYGGLYFAYLRPPGSMTADPDPVFVFAATLSQESVNLRSADEHFDMLVRALKQIDRNVRVA